MIVQCGQCNTKFRLDDAKVKDAGVKVRCSKCRHIFTVYPEPVEADSGFGSVLDGITSKGGAGMIPRPEETSGRPSTGFPAEGIAAPEATRPAPAPDERLFSDQHDADAPSPEPAVSGGFDFGFTEADGSTAGAAEGTASAAEQAPGRGEGSGGEFDFTEPGPDEMPGDMLETTAGETALSYPDQSYTSEFEFGGAEEEIGQIPPDEGFDISEDGGSFFLDSSDETAEQTALDDTPFPLPEDNPAAAAEETFAGMGATEEQKGEEDFVITSDAASRPAAGTSEELPPLPIASRRRTHATFPIIITGISIVFVIFLAGAGFFFLGEGPEALNKVGLGFLSEWAGLQPSDEGNIALRATSGTFLVNKEAGELFVVRGEAVNGFRKPRASIQVRALIYGPKGAVLARKTAYCGNALTKEQLMTLPMAKIEAAMNNQFGDSLSNMGVAAGKAIPFILVFSQLPKEAVEYGVEVAGSTVASQ